MYRFTIHSNMDSGQVKLFVDDDHCARCLIVGLSDAGIDTFEIEEMIPYGHGGEEMWIPSSVDSVFLTINRDYEEFKSEHGGEQS
jgi:hypothetical protein